jgi:hypothetical protein
VSTTVVVYRAVHGENSFIVPHTNSIKPFLSEENRYGRVCYAVDRIETRTSSNEEQQRPPPLIYSDFYDSIHVDEKWFFLTEENMQYYTTKAEKEEGKTPKRLCAHKSHIIMVMFLAAVAQPIFDNDGRCIFDGKIGLWPFVEFIAAKRLSNRRAKGTIETKPVSVKKENYLRMIINKVLPSIRSKWPGATTNHCERARNPHIQHNNSPVHFNSNHTDWTTASQMGGWSIGLKNQCPNSPDTNECDLGFFWMLQLERWKFPCAKNVDELIEHMQEAFDLLDPRSIDANFLTLQSCLDEIIQCHGGNDYRIPHLGKKKRCAALVGKLPDALPVSDAAKMVIEELELQILMPDSI